MLCLCLTACGRTNGEGARAPEPERQQLVYTAFALSDFGPRERRDGRRELVAAPGRALSLVWVRCTWNRAEGKPPVCRDASDRRRARQKESALELWAQDFARCFPTRRALPPPAFLRLLEQGVSAAAPAAELTQAEVESALRRTPPASSATVYAVELATIDRIVAREHHCDSEKNPDCAVEDGPDVELAPSSLLSFQILARDRGEPLQAPLLPSRTPGAWQLSLAAASGGGNTDLARGIERARAGDWAGAVAAFERAESTATSGASRLLAATNLAVAALFAGQEPLMLAALGRANALRGASESDLLNGGVLVRTLLDLQRLAEPPRYLGRQPCTRVSR